MVGGFRVDFVVDANNDVDVDHDVDVGFGNDASEVHSLMSKLLLRILCVRCCVCGLMKFALLFFRFPC